MLINFKDKIGSLSLQNNSYFRDFCLKQLIEYLIDTSYLKYLSLEKVNVSDSSLVKLFDILPQTQLEVLNLSSNTINYCAFEHFTKVIREKGLYIKFLNLSNTKLSEKGGIELFEAIIEYSKVEELDLSRNPGLGYKFSINAINTLKKSTLYSLFCIELSYCGISQ